MKLRPHGREFYGFTAITTPAVSGWEASFDAGETWILGELVDLDDPAEGALRVRWLVAGAAAEVGDAVAVISRTTTPLVRAPETPELVARTGPVIYV